MPMTHTQFSSSMSICAFESPHAAHRALQSKLWAPCAHGDGTCVLCNICSLSKFSCCIAFVLMAPPELRKLCIAHIMPLKLTRLSCLPWSHGYQNASGHSRALMAVSSGHEGSVDFIFLVTGAPDSSSFTG